MPEPPKFYPGQPLSAAQLNQICDAMATRFAGRAPIQVSKNGGQVVVGLHDDRIVKGGSVRLGDTNGTDVTAAAGTDGVSVLGARIDHTHKGQIFCDTVESLPAIPTVGMREVFWTSTGAGDGDDQVWRAYAGQTRWYPTQKWTDLSGTP